VLGVSPTKCTPDIEVELFSKDKRFSSEVVRLLFALAVMFNLEELKLTGWITVLFLAIKSVKFILSSSGGLLLTFGADKDFILGTSLPSCPSSNQFKVRFPLLEEI